MATCRLKGVRISQLACAVPGQTVSTDEAHPFGAQEAAKVRESTGVARRHVVSPDTCASDLCLAAAELLLENVDWDRDTIGTLLLVTQTPDYVLPATSCVLHGRLGLSNQCAALDVNLGCSGYVYGLWQAAQWIACGSARRVLLLAGDTISRLTSPLDRSTATLFGDAGTATILQRDEDAPPMVFTLGTDGTGCDRLIVPAGAFRRPHGEQTSVRTVRDDGSVRSEEDLYMDGAEVFAFSLREVPRLINSTLALANWSLEEVDSVVMHQANAFILRHVARRLKLPAEKFVLAMEEFGNTSSASIPLAINYALAKPLATSSRRLVLAGFGVGFSWAAAAITCGPLTMPPIINYQTHKAQTHKAQTHKAQTHKAQTHKAATAGRV